MTLWQSPVRVGIASFVVAFAALVFVGIRERGDPAAALIVNRADPTAIVQTTGAQVVETTGALENVRIEAGRQLMYADGAQRMADGVRIEMAAEQDRDALLIVGREATVSADGARWEVAGDVQFTSGTLAGRTAAVAYDSQAGLLRIPGPSEFAQEQLTAFGQRAEFDSARRLLSLHGEARVRLAPEPEKSVEVRAETAVLARADGYMHFGGGVVIETDAYRMEAAQATAQTAADQARLRQLELGGGARLMTRRTAAPPVGNMRADEITLVYDERGVTLQRALLAGDAALALAGGSRGGTRITAGSAEVELTPEGDGLARLTARDAVEATFPSRDDQRAQRIRSSALEARGNESGLLTSARFDGDVDYREQPRSTDEPERRATARRLEARLGEDATAVASAQFRGNVRFTEGTTAGEADEVRYDPLAGRVELRALGSAGRTPRLIDERGSVDASAIVLTLDGPLIDAEGAVRSVLATEPRTSRPDATSPPSRLPGLIERERPVFVTATRFRYDGGRRVATYQGQARLWQEDTEFRGETIIIDEQTGDLRADGSVQTRTRVVDRGAGARGAAPTTNTGRDARAPAPATSASSAPAPAPDGRLTMSGRGGSLNYDEQSRRATYRVGAQVSGPQGDLKGDEIVIVLAAENALDRVEAAGKVTLQLNARWGSGATLTYDAKEGRYDMEGSPVRIIEQVGAECRESTGRLLTFYRSVDTILIDGQSQSRTRTTSGKCPELKFD